MIRWRLFLFIVPWRYVLSLCMPRRTSFPSWWSWTFAILKKNFLRFQPNRDLEEIVRIVPSYPSQDYICTLYESSRTHFHTFLKYSPVYQSSHGFPSPLHSVLRYYRWCAISTNCYIFLIGFIIVVYFQSKIVIEFGFHFKVILRTILPTTRITG